VNGLRELKELKELKKLGALLWILGLVAASSSVSGAGAIDAFEFEDQADEQRYRALIDELRCPKCLNTNLSGSDAPIAADLRREVHRMVISGATDAEVLDFLRQRYGDFVLYDPPLRPGTAVLWGLPIVLALIAGIVVVTVRRRARVNGPILSPEENARLAALVGATPERPAR
jgi:cytochrome c-type biogenesis protein CcmH